MSESPAAKLVPPAPTDPMPKVVDTTLSLTDFVSPGHWLLWAIDKICGVNPAEWVGQQMGGDWESISKMSSALTHVSEFYASYGTALKDGSTTMLKDWEGAAAAACGKYFRDFTESVSKQESPLKRVADECRSVAYGAWSTSKAIVSLLEALLDQALMIAIEAAAAAATSWTIVGPSVAMAAIMSQIGAAIKLWLKIISNVGFTISAVHALLGLISGSLGAIYGLDAQPFPNGSYDNKVVG